MQTPLPLGQILAVYLLFRLKQLAADYLLQTSWMARGKVQRSNWICPLFAHAGVHALGTTSIALLFAPHLWWLGVVDFLVHASIDRLKAVPVLGSRWQPSQPVFWWLHGVDQEAHNLTHLAFVLVLILV